ncbi:MAG: tRNA 2-thiouridine(34) synthase MnmA [Treponemataceae bacterium]|nr:MAG: tRNA 2-thiouridine(34) synthase MnmA [Treponemataceae bacterium]
MVFSSDLLPLPEKGAAVAVGLSGGVDSALTAVLLKERGCNVIGMTMSHWSGGAIPAANKTGSVSPQRHSCYGPDEETDIEECREFCKKYDIPYHVVDVASCYKTEVLDYFTGEYRSGRTPNPCVMCNERIKFGAFLQGAKNAGIAFDYFCTGHYASVVNISLGAGGKKIAAIKCSGDSAKDQTYFLYRIASNVLETVRFPLGSFTKAHVKEMARERGLAAVNRSESQDFIPDEYAESLFADKPSVAGDIVDLDGRVLGQHRGIEHYTIGQRKGLGVSAPQALYVHSIDAETNRIVLADESALFSKACLVDKIVWTGGQDMRDFLFSRDSSIAKLSENSTENLGDNAENFCAGNAPAFSARVKVRLATPAVDALVSIHADGILQVTFGEAQRALTCGQSAVFYIDDIIVGGGIISGIVK